MGLSAVYGASARRSVRASTRSFVARPAGVSQPEAFAESFEQVEAAERWGLDAMWLAEIHVAPERSVCAAPLTIASAIAACVPTW